MNLNFTRCSGKECQEPKRPILVLAQGVTYHYDGGKCLPEKAREIWNEFMVPRTN